MELTKFIHLLLLKKLITYICDFDPCREHHQLLLTTTKKPLKTTSKKLITYICGFDPCREQHQVVTNSLYESKTLSNHSLSLKLSINLKIWNVYYQISKYLNDYLITTAVYLELRRVVFNKDNCQ